MEILRSILVFHHSETVIYNIFACKHLLFKNNLFLRKMKIKILGCDFFFFLGGFGWAFFVFVSLLRMMEAGRGDSVKRAEMTGKR